MVISGLEDEGILQCVCTEYDIALVGEKHMLCFTDFSLRPFDSENPRRAQLAVEIQRVEKPLPNCGDESPFCGPSIIKREVSRLPQTGKPV